MTAPVVFLPAFAAARDPGRRRAWNSTLPAPDQPMRRLQGLRQRPGHPRLQAAPGNIIDLATGQPLTVPDEGTVRRLVLERDGFRCVCCGESILGRHYSLGHRRRASQGGLFTPSNLLVFLGWGGELCHGRIDSRRDPQDELNGLTVRSYDDPALVPVTVATPDGPGLFWLTDDASRVDYPPSGDVA